MFNSKTLVTAIAALVLVGSSLLAVSSAYAATLTWDIAPGTVGVGNGTVTGGTGTWDTTNGNWTTDGGVNNIAWDNTSPSVNTAVFGAVAGVSVVTLGETINIKTLTINSVTGANRYTIQGSTLAFPNGGSITWNSTNNTNFTDVSSINSAITGAPTVTGAGTSGNTQFVFAPTAGSQTLGKLGGVTIYRLAGSTTGNSFTGTASATSNDTKIFVSSGASWTLTGVASGYEHQINGTLIIGPGGTLRNGARDTALTSTGILHWNNAAAIQDGAISTQRDRDFRIDGGSIDNTSGAAITSSTHNPQMRWNGNWTFIGSNGANSNLNMGTGQVFLGATRQVTVTNAATTLTVGGVIAGSGFGLTKAGDGTLKLTGNSSYTGATTVNGGTLLINGSTHSSSTVTVNGGTLGGTGTIGGAVNINSGGILAAGGSIESLATGTLTLNGGSTFAYEMNKDALPGVAGDLTAVTGGLILDTGNGAVLTLSESGSGAWTIGEKLTLISYSDTWNNGLFNFNSSTLADDSTFNHLGTDWKLNYNDTAAGTNYVADLTGPNYVTLTVIPEPGTLSVLAVFGLGILARRRLRS